MFKGAGIAAVRLIPAGGRIRIGGIRSRIISPRAIAPGVRGPGVIRPLLVKGPVAAGERCGDQDKLNTSGLFHLVLQG